MGLAQAALIINILNTMRLGVAQPHSADMMLRFLVSGCSLAGCL